MRSCASIVTFAIASSFSLISSSSALIPCFSCLRRRSVAFVNRLTQLREALAPLREQPATSRRRAAELDTRAAVSRDRLDHGAGPGATEPRTPSEALPTPEVSAGSRRACVREAGEQEDREAEHDQPPRPAPGHEEADRHTARAATPSTSSAVDGGTPKNLPLRDHRLDRHGPGLVRGHLLHRRLSRPVRPSASRTQGRSCAFAGSLAPQLEHSARGTDALLIRLGTKLERTQRFGNSLPQRADQLPVVVVRDLPGPVVELELLQRRRAPGHAARPARARAVRARRARRARRWPDRARAEREARRRARRRRPARRRWRSRARSCPCERAQLAVAGREAALLGRARPQGDERAREEDEA